MTLENIYYKIRKRRCGFRNNLYYQSKLSESEVLSQLGLLIWGFLSRGFLGVMSHEGILKSGSKNHVVFAPFVLFLNIYVLK